MWKNIWPLLLLGAVGYAYYTGWDPLQDIVRPTSPSPHSQTTQAGGPALARQAQQMPQMMHDIGGEVASGGPAQAARAAAQRVAGGN